MLGQQLTLQACAQVAATFAHNPESSTVSAARMDATGLQKGTSCALGSLIHRTQQVTKLC